MAYPFNPTSGEAGLLAQIAQRESSGNYGATNPASSASGAYQFIDATWQWVSRQTGVGTQYASAADAPPSVQDANALWLLRKYGPDASISWAASGPYLQAAPEPYYGTAAQPLVDVAGDGAGVSTGAILGQVESALGIDETTGMPSAGAIVLGVGAAAILYFLVTS